MSRRQKQHLRRLNSENENTHWTDVWPKLNPKQQQCNLRKVQKILSKTPAAKRCGTKRKASKDDVSNSKYMRGVSVGETTTRLQMTDTDGTSKYKKKKSTTDKQMYNDDQTGYDILGWVSSKTYNLFELYLNIIFYLIIIFRLIIWFRKLNQTFKSAPSC